MILDHKLVPFLLKYKMKMVIGLVLLFGQIAVLATGYGIVALFGVRLAAAILTWAILSWTYIRKFPKSQRTTPPKERPHLFSEIWPFEVTVFISGVYAQIDILMLMALTEDGDTEIGLYRAAAFFLLQLPFLANILIRGVYPRMAQHLNNPDATAKELTFILRILLLLSIPIAVGGMCVAEPLLVLIGGTAYLPAVPALLILLPALPLRFLNAAFGMTLSALNRQKRRARIDLIAAVVNFFANLVVIPFYGFIGAAFTTLLTDIILCVLLGNQARKLSTPLSWKRILALTIIPTLIMGVVVILLVNVHVLIRIGLGAMLYLGFTYLMGAWNKDDLSQLKRI